jgi:hypothetical protein
VSSLTGFVLTFFTWLVFGVCCFLLVLKVVFVPFVFSNNYIDIFFLTFNYKSLCKMATFHLEGKLELTIFLDAYGVLFVTEKCLCVMFGLKPKTMHISKEDA